MRAIEIILKYTVMKELIFLVLLGLPLGVFAQDSTYMSMEDALLIALQDNLEFNSAKSNLEASRANVKVTAAGYIPQIGIAGSYSESATATFSEAFGILPTSTGLVGMTLNQTIFNEMVFAGHKAQKYLLASEEQNLKNIENNTIAMVASAYIQSLQARDLLDVYRKNLELTKVDLQMAKDRLELGATLAQEVLRWETQVYAAEQRVATQQATAAMAANNLNQLLNLPSNEKVRMQKLTMELYGFLFANEELASIIGNPILEEKLADYLVALGHKTSPILRSLEHAMLAQERMYKAQKRWAIPSLTLGAGAATKWLGTADGNQVNEGEDFFWKWQLGFQWNIFDGGASIQKTKMARFQNDALQFDYQNLKSTIEKNIRSLTSRVISDYRNMELTLAQAETSKQNYTLVNEAYLIGKNQLLDLIDAQEQQLSAAINERNSVYAFFQNLITLEQLMGYYPFMSGPETNAEIINELKSNLN